MYNGIQFTTTSEMHWKGICVFFPQFLLVTHHTNRIFFQEKIRFLLFFFDVFVLIMTHRDFFYVYMKLIRKKFEIEFTPWVSSTIIKYAIYYWIMKKLSYTGKKKSFLKLEYLQTKLFCLYFLWSQTQTLYVIWEVFFSRLFLHVYFQFLIPTLCLFIFILRESESSQEKGNLNK